MIKTEIKTDAAEPVPVAALAGGISPKQYAGFAGVTAAVLVGLVLYLLFSGEASIAPVKGANIGNQPALPLASTATSGLSSHSANNSSDSQSSNETGTLSASSFNLQNNLPAGQGSTQSSPLQPTSSTLGGGQPVN